MKALVLGGTRFVGLRLVRCLAGQGHDVTILNRGRTQTSLPPRIRRLYADRRDQAAFRSALTGEKFDAVFDMTGYDVSNLEPAFEVFAGRVEHYVFQSTCGVYGAPDTIPVTEDFPRVRPDAREPWGGAYVANKVRCEDYLLSKHRESGFPVTILRSPEIYGPENWMHEREFSYMVRLTEGRNILVPGHGAIFLCFVHVDDVAAAHLAVAGRKEALGRAYNVAGPDAVTIDQYVDIMAEALEVDARKKYVPSETMKRLEKPVFPFPWDRSALWGIGRARQELGYNPAYAMSDGIKQVCRWWRENLGVAKTRLDPGKTGYNVDLAFEERVAAQLQ